MQEKSSDATPQRPDGERILDAPMLAIDLPFYIDQIRKESPWKESDRNAITIFKSDHLRLVLVALHAGAEMAKHTAPGIIHIQVLEGNILFTAGERSAEMSRGQLVVLHEGIAHSVIAKTESVFLLSVAIR